MKRNRMEKFWFALMLGAVGTLLSVGAIIEACTPAETKAIIRTAIDVELAECIAQNPGKDMPALQAICKYSPEVANVVERFLASQNKGLAAHDEEKKLAAPKVDCVKKDGG